MIRNNLHRSHEPEEVMVTVRPFASLVMALALAPLFLQAQPLVIQPTKAEKVTEVRTVKLAKGSNLKVKNINGRIHLQGWDREEVEFTGAFKPSSQDEQVRVVLEPVADGLEIRGEYPKRKENGASYRGPECQMDLKVPRKIMAQLENINGEVAMADTFGQARCRTVNGDIQVKDLEGALHAETVNGAIDLDGIRGDLTLDTVNGAIRGKRLEVQGQGLSAKSVNGDIVLKTTGIQGRLKATTVNGDLSMKAAGAQDVEIKARKVTANFPGSEQSLRLSTVNGSITLE